MKLKRYQFISLIYSIGQLLIQQVYSQIANCQNYDQTNQICVKCNTGYLVQLQKLCVQQCQDYQYSDGTQCNSCSSSIANCWKCTYANSNVSCTACLNSYNLSQNSSQCYQIINNCSQYSQDYSKCQQCATNFTLSSDNLSCLSSCDLQTPGYIQIGASCVQCSAPCQTCSKTKTNCTSCQSQTLFLDLNLNPAFQGEYTCQSLCNNPLTSYVDQNQKCQPCNSSCLSCVNNPYYCTSCYKDKFLQMLSGQIFGICQSTCNTGYFQNQQTNTCDNCSSNCDSCSNSQFCNTCSSGYSLLQVSSTQSECVQQSSVVPGFYFDQNSQQFLKCSSSCVTCQNSSQFCTSCQQPLLLDVQGGFCLPTCPINKLQTGQQCIGCQDLGVLNCNQCQRNGQNVVCTSCQLGFYLNNGSCSKCDSSCKDCLGSATSCTLCNYPLVLDKGSCKSTCSQGEYVDNTYTCQQCNSECGSCFGQSYNCTSCTNKNQFIDLISPTIPGKYTCKNSCNNPITAYRDANNYCQPCSPNCYQCSGSANNCVSCLGNQFLQSSVDANNNPIQICTQNCPITSYQDPTSGSCKACDSSCYSCSSSLATNCTSCKSPNILTVNLLQNFYCAPSCNLANGYFMSYRNLTINNTLQQVPTCEQCSSSCSLCQDSPSKCIQCITSQSLYQSTCINSCPVGYYKQMSTDGKSSVCQQCYSTCKTCSNPSQICTSCIDEYYQGQDGKCYPCEFPCQNCKNSATNCISCFDTMYFIPSTNSCVYTCDFSNGYYTQINTNICLKCDSSCLTCQNYPTQCIVCAYGLLLQNYPDPKQNKCVPSCSIGWYKDQKTNSNCLQCDASCQTCSDQFTCTTCPVSQYLQQSYVSSDCINQGCAQQTKCVSQCNVGFYPSGNNCLQCDPTCQQCTGQYQCLVCKKDYFLQYKISGQNICQKTCNQGYLPDSNNVCQLCTSNCSVCASSTQCETCDEANNYEKDPLTKLCVCKEGYYSQNNACLQCPPNLYFNNTGCKTCSQKQTIGFTCDSCKIQYYLSNQDITIYTPIGCNILIDNSCAYITYQYSVCQSCNTTTLSNAATCDYDSTLLQIYALTCSDGYFLYSDQNTRGICLQCSTNCKTCSYYTSCLTCQNDYFLDENNICRQYCFDKSPQQQYIPLKNANSQYSCFYSESDIPDNCIRRSNCILYQNGTCASYQCQMCKYGYFLDYSNSTSPTCYQQCPAGYAKQTVSGNFQCIQSINQNCKVYDQYGNNCIQCNPSYYLLNTGTFTQCTQSCPDGYYSRIDITLGDKCYKCSDNCQTCKYQSNNCQTCDPSTNFKYIMITPHTITVGGQQYNKQQCVQQCPLNSNVDQQTLTCFTCSSLCTSCQDKPNKCSGCKDGTLIFPLIYQDPNIKISPYLNDTSLKGQQFQLCLKSCSQSELNLLGIFTIRYYYANNSSPQRTCQICPKGCIYCNPWSTSVISGNQSDILEYQCSLCDTSLNYFSNNYGGCKLAVCGDGFKDANEQCDDGNNTNYDGCNSQCQIESGWSCTNDLGKSSLCNTICGDSSIIGYKLGGKETCDAGSNQGKIAGCSSQCTIIPGYFCAIPQNSAKSQCGLPCLGSCKKCQVNQDGVTSCVQCANPNSFINGLGCVDQCQSGLLRNPITQSCQQTCPSLYSSIDYVANMCVSYCPQNLFSINKQTYFECRQDCPPGYYKDYYESIQICSLCDQSCSTCSSSLPTDCMTCSNNLLYHVHDFYNVCKPTCDPGFQLGQLNNQNVCVPCLTQCTACAPNLYLFNGNCSPTCDVPNTSKDSTTWTCYYNSVPSVSIQQENTSGIYGFVNDYKLFSVIDQIYQVQSYLWTLPEETSAVSTQFFYGVAQNQTTLVIKGANLISNKVYKIQLQAVINNSQYFATIQITTMQNPNIQLFVTPTKGSYLTTVFQFKTLGWPSYMNKTYYYTLVGLSSINTANNIQILSGYSQSDISISFVFPLQSQDQIYTIQLNILTQDFSILPVTQIYVSQNQMSIGNITTYIMSQKFTSVLDIQSAALSFNYATQDTINSISSNFNKQQLLYQTITNDSTCTAQDNCSGNGKCMIISSQIQCNCDSNYSGQYCQYTQDELAQIQNVSFKILSELERYGVDSTNTYEYAMSLDSLTSLTDTFNRTTINSLRQNLRQLLQLGAINNNALPVVMDSLMGYLQICQYSYRQNYLLKEYLYGGEQDYVHSDLLLVGNNYNQIIDKGLQDAQFYNQDGNTIIDNLIANQALYSLPQDDGHFFGKAAGAKISINNYQTSNIQSLIKYNLSQLVRLLKESSPYQNSIRNLQALKSNTVSLVDFSASFLSDLQKYLIQQNISSFSLSQVEYTNTNPFIESSQLIYSSVLKIGLVNQTNNQISMDFKSLSGSKYLVYLQKTTITPGQNAVCAVYNQTNQQYEDQKLCTLNNQNNAFYYVCECSTFGYIAIKEFDQLTNQFSNISQKSFFQRILSNFGFMFSISNIILLLVLLLILFIFKKDKDILKEDYKALHPLYSILFINDILNPREIRLMLFFLTIAQQAFFEALLFQSQDIQNLGASAIPVVGICGVLISSILNYMTGLVHFFTVFKETVYFRKWLPFFLVVFIELIGYYVGFTTIADNLTNQIMPTWLSTFFTGFLLDILILDMIFMALSIKVKYIRNLVQIRGFFSGKIITLDELKKEKIQIHIENIQRKIKQIQEQKFIQFIDNK
ncbi:hypothetical protein ABPG74_011993 [Tetrahymena malaccensis]